MVKPPADNARVPVTVCIPTYRREEVLVATIGQFLDERPAPAEVLVVDQTPRHTPDVDARLAAWQSQGEIRWLRRTAASQPGALNEGLREARSPYVLFVDDDIRLDPGLLAKHLAAFDSEAVWAVVGQILQPGQEEDTTFQHRPESGPFADFEFPFHSARPSYVANVMSGNLMVRRRRALDIGGFDEAFVPPVSYRFDSDFARRLVDAGGKIRFAPDARIHHLRAGRGGTRSNSSHLTSASPEHGVGDYYYALRHAAGLARWRYILKRPFKEVATRFHARHPWWIPVKLLGEARAFRQAARLCRRRPVLLGRDDGRGSIVP